MAASDTWSTLPSLIIVEILSYLSLTDRLNATSICRRWRGCLFHPNLWRSLTFRLTNGVKSKQLVDVCGQFVKEATVVFHPGNQLQCRDFTKLVKILSSNANLEKLSLFPSPSNVPWIHNKIQAKYDQWVDAFEKILKTSRGLKHLSLGCLNIFTDHSDTWLDLLNDDRHASKIECLFICSIKEDPDNYGLLQIPINPFANFRKLHSLGLDYDNISNDFLEALIHRRGTSLKNLVIHVHGIDHEKEPISNAIWRQLANNNHEMKVTLNLIHSMDGISSLLDILRPSMPLAHFRAFFCHQLNLAAIDFMTRKYTATLQSIHIVDCMPTTPHYYQASTDEDPFVMMAWKCPLLSHFTLIGYEINAENVIAIARLRGKCLKAFEIPHCCISTVEDDEEHAEDNNGVWVTYGNVGADFNEEVSKSLGRLWEAIPDEELLSAVIDPYADPEPVYLPVLLQDQQPDHK